MGLPSLFEDILDKQLDNLLRDQIGNGQFFSKDELRGFLRQMGVTAKSLFAVDDKKLTQKWEQAVQESNNLRSERDDLRENLSKKENENQNLRLALTEQALYRNWKEVSLKNDNLRNKVKKLKEESNQLKRQLNALMSEKDKLDEQCAAQKYILKTVEAENLELRSEITSWESKLCHCQKSRDRLEREVGRYRAELEELHRQKMQKLIGE